MLAEKFMLVLEARLRNDRYQDGSQRVHEDQPVSNTGPQTKQDIGRTDRLTIKQAAN